MTINDQQLAALVHAALLRDERLSAQPINVSVQDRMVRLSGIVQSFRRKLVAQEIAAHFEHVRDVRNALTVEPAFVNADHEVATYVRSSLDAHADITKEAITVGVDAGKVTLTGHVASRWERSLADDIARSARGVRDVQNLLVINEFEKSVDEQMSAQICVALSHARGLRDADIHVAISDTAVVLSGEVQHLWQKETAQSVTERFRPVTIQNEIVVNSSTPDA